MITTTLLVSATAALCPQSPEFHPPVRLEADGKPISVEAPGYAAPYFGDVDGDGKKDLLVGQFHKGKIAVYANLGDGRFAPRKWLQADGKTAEIPGVW